MPPLITWAICAPKAPAHSRSTPIHHQGHPSTSNSPESLRSLLNQITRTGGPNDAAISACTRHKQPPKHLFFRMNSRLHSTSARFVFFLLKFQSNGFSRHNRYVTRAPWRTQPTPTSCDRNFSRFPADSCLDNQRRKPAQRVDEIC